MDVTDISRWLRGSALEAILLVLGTILLVRGLRTVLRWATPRLPGNPTDLLPEHQRYRRAALQAVERTFVGILWFVTAILVLNRLGVPINTLVAPATVVGAAVGFGAQRVVADFLAGFFLITERQYGFGDVIQISPPGTPGGVSGTVEEVSLRFTRLRTPDGETLMLPNSEIRQVVNRSKVAGTVEVDVPLPIEVELDPLVASLEESLRELGEDDTWTDRLLDEPVVAGVQKVDLDRVDLRLSARAAPGARAEVARELRRRGAVVASAALNEGGSTGGPRTGAGDADVPRRSTIALCLAFVATFALYLGVRPDPAASRTAGTGGGDPVRVVVESTTTTSTEPPTTTAPLETTTTTTPETTTSTETPATTEGSTTTTTTGPSTSSSTSSSTTTTTTTQPG